VAKSDKLRDAKAAKNDEYYTQIDDINAEIYNYCTDRADLGLKNQFKDKIVFCNCDDPEWSNFWKYFKMKFSSIGLKKLISTHYEKGKTSYKLEYDGVNTVKTPLIGDGDFRSQECIEILKEADIIVTNPPFSLFREYVAQLIEYKKKFIIIGSKSAVAYKEIFPLMKNNTIWLGVNESKGSMYFATTIDGKDKKSVPSYWYTNMEHYKIHQDLDISDYYYGNEDKYPKYDNYDGINVGAIDDIPCDYEGVMGVPVTIFQHLNPEQFEIIGMGTGDNAKEVGITKNYRGRTDLAITVNGKSTCPFNRILIRNKKIKKEGK